MPITTCVFDAYGTLFDVAAAARMAAALPENSEISENWAKLANDWLYGFVDTCLPRVPVLRVVIPRSADVFVKIILPTPHVDVPTMMLLPFMLVRNMSNRVVVPMVENSVSVSGRVKFSQAGHVSAPIQPKLNIPLVPPGMFDIRVV